MKDSRVYSVVFTVVLCGACAVLLTFANTQWAELIKANEEYAFTFAVTDSLGLVAAEDTRAQVIESFKKHVMAKPRGEMQVYEGLVDGQLVGVAVPIEAKGKYGPIKGILALNPDNQSIKALRVYEHNETPGLGGEVANPKWLANFNDLPLLGAEGAEPGIIISSTVEGPNVVDGISSASKTTHAMGLTINAAIASFLSGGMKLEALDLGLDAVTKTTPGYPKKMEIPPHLRPQVKRAPFMVPPGLINLARGKDVTCSIDMGPIIGELEQLTDGVKTCTDFDCVEMDPGPQWVQVDLGDVRRIYAVVVWHFYKQPTIYNDVIVQLCDDPEFEEGVKTIFNNDHDNSAGMGTGTDTAFYSRWWGEIADARGPGKQGMMTRYVRVYSSDGCGREPTRFVEIDVYGEKNEQVAAN